MMNILKNNTTQVYITYNKVKSSAFIEKHETKRET